MEDILVTGGDAAGGDEQITLAQELSHGVGHLPRIVADEQPLHI